MIWPFVIILLALLAVYAGICLIYFLIQERLIFVSFRLSKGYRFRFKFPFEERFVQAKDGSELHGLIIKAKKPVGVLLYFHGNTGTVRRWAKHAHRFTKLGFDVWMPDHRGYGKSRGPLSEQAFMDDASTWYDEMRRQWPAESVVIYGRSLGSAMAVPLAARVKPRLLLLETPFAELADPARFYFRWIPYSWLLKYKFENHRWIEKVECPVYIFHGERDQVVPYGSALRLYSHIPSHVERELISIPEGRHSDLTKFPAFQRKLKKVLIG